MNVRFADRAPFAGWGWKPPKPKRTRAPHVPLMFGVLDALRADPALLRVTTRALVRDVQERFGICESHAYDLIETARSGEPVDSVHVEQRA